MDLYSMGRAYYRKDICSWDLGGLYSGGLIIRRIFAPEIWGAYIREGLLSKGYLIAPGIWGAYYREGLLSEGYLLLRFGGLIIGRAYYRKDICSWDLGGLLSGGFIFGRAYYRKDICSWDLGAGLIFGRAYFWEGFLSEFYGSFCWTNFLYQDSI